MQTKEQMVGNLIKEVGEDWRATIKMLTEEQLDDLINGGKI